MRFWPIFVISFFVISCSKETPKPEERASVAAASEAREQVKSPVVQKLDEPPQEVVDAGFFATGKPMLLDFTRDNCLPCRIMAPWVEDIRKSYAGKADVVEINLDKPENRELEKYFKIRSVPTQIYLDAQGRVRLRHAGMSTLNEMLNVMKQLK